MPSSDSKFVFGTCVSERATFEIKKGDKLFSPIGFVEVDQVDGDDVRCRAVSPFYDDVATFDKDEVEHVSVNEWPNYDRSRQDRWKNR